MRRKLHYGALVWLVLVTAATLWVIWLAYLAHVADPRIFQYGRPKGWGSALGEYGTWIVLVSAPLIAWLVHKAFFSSFRR